MSSLRKIKINEREVATARILILASLTNTYRVQPCESRHNFLSRWRKRQERAPAIEICLTHNSNSTHAACDSATKYRFTTRCPAIDLLKYVRLGKQRLQYFPKRWNGAANATSPILFS